MLVSLICLVANFVAMMIYDFTKQNVIFSYFFHPCSLYFKRLSLLSFSMHTATFLFFFFFFEHSYTRVVPLFNLALTCNTIKYKNTPFFHSLFSLRFFLLLCFFFSSTLCSLLWWENDWSMLWDLCLSLEFNPDPFLSGELDFDLLLSAEFDLDVLRSWDCDLALVSSNWEVEFFSGRAFFLSGDCDLVLFRSGDFDCVLFLCLDCDHDPSLSLDNDRDLFLSLENDRDLFLSLKTGFNILLSLDNDRDLFLSLDCDHDLCSLLLSCLKGLRSFSLSLRCRSFSRSKSFEKSPDLQHKQPQSLKM